MAQIPYSALRRSNLTFVKDSILDSYSNKADQIPNANNLKLIAGIIFGSISASIVLISIIVFFILFNKKAL